MRNYRFLAALVLSVFLVLAVSGCAASTSPSIKIISPADGSTVPAGPVTITVQVSNFNLVSKLGSPAVAGEGHIHYYIDVEAPTTPGKPATTAPGTFSPNAGTSYTWKDVAPGTHTFVVQLANNDHTPVIPLVTNKITVTVK